MPGLLGMKLHPGQIQSSLDVLKYVFVFPCFLRQATEMGLYIVTVVSDAKVEMANSNSRSPLYT